MPSNMVYLMTTVELTLSIMRRDGCISSGSYKVALPDGRIQIVNYLTEDAYSGNNIDVTSDGVPTYGPGPVNAGRRGLQ